MIQRTSAGTQGIVNATRADEIITGAFVNAGAIIRYITKTKPKNVSLVCMGWEAKRESTEDTALAEYIQGTVLGEKPNFAALAAQRPVSDSATRIFRGCRKKIWTSVSPLTFLISCFAAGMSTVYCGSRNTLFRSLISLSLTWNGDEITRLKEVLK